MSKFHEVINELEDEIAQEHVMDEHAINNLKNKFGRITKDNIGIILQSVYSESFRNGLVRSLEIIRKRRKMDYTT